MCCGLGNTNVKKKIDQIIQTDAVTVSSGSPLQKNPPYLGRIIAAALSRASTRLKSVLTQRTKAVSGTSSSSRCWTWFEKKRWFWGGWGEKGREGGREGDNGSCCKEREQTGMEHYSAMPKRWDKSTKTFHGGSSTGWSARFVCQMLLFLMDFSLRLLVFLSSTHPSSSQTWQPTQMQSPGEIAAHCSIMKSKCQLTDNRRHNHLKSSISGDYICEIFITRSQKRVLLMFEIYILSIQLIILTKQQ